METPIPKSKQIRGKSIKLTNGDKLAPAVPLGVKLLDRGMNQEECKIICTHHSIPVREKLFYRLIYETLFRPFEVLNLQIDNWDRNQRLITAMRVKTKTKPMKGDRHKKVYMDAKPRTAILSEQANDLLREYVGNRKKGYIFVNAKGEQLDRSYFKKAINRRAKRLGLQQEVLRYDTENGEVHSRHLITCMALREAGERHHDVEGGDRKLSAIMAGHTMEVKDMYYGKPDFEEVHTSMLEHHPAFRW